MSRVFLAEEVAFGRMVVIKVLSPEKAEGLLADRFAREIRLAANLQHPHIVPLFSAGSIDGLPYYTMPYVAGESLRARLSRKDKICFESFSRKEHEHQRRRLRLKGQRPSQYCHSRT